MYEKGIDKQRRERNEGRGKERKEIKEQKNYIYIYIYKENLAKMPRWHEIRSIFASERASGASRFMRHTALNGTASLIYIYIDVVEHSSSRIEYLSGWWWW